MIDFFLLFNLNFFNNEHEILFGYEQLLTKDVKIR